MRPEQWIKNAFVLIPVIFAKRISHPESLIIGFSATAVFCLLASAVYLINDLNDVVADREHPIKQARPLTSGQLSVVKAKWATVLLICISLLGGFLLGKAFLLVLILYLSVQWAYNFGLKKVVILDLFCVSTGFFLRVAGGAFAVNVEISNWLIICTIGITMLLSLGKRKGEMALLGIDRAIRHRKVFAWYSLPLLDQMIGIVAALSLLSYMLYCISPQTIAKFETDHLVYTFPFALYGVFRYLYLISRKAPDFFQDKMLVYDRPLLVCAFLWIVSCILIIYHVI